MSPALNGSLEIQRFERANASEICDRIMFVFYPGLSHTIIVTKILWEENLGGRGEYSLPLVICSVLAIQGKQLHAKPSFHVLSSCGPLHCTDISVHAVHTYSISLHVPWLQFSKELEKNGALIRGPMHSIFALLVCA